MPTACNLRWRRRRGTRHLALGGECGEKCPGMTRYDNLGKEFKRMGLGTAYMPRSADASPGLGWCWFRRIGLELRWGR